MNRDEVIEHVAQVLHEKNPERVGRPWVRAGERMKTYAREHARHAIVALENLGYARGPEDVTALMWRTFDTGVAVGRTTERYAAVSESVIDGRIIAIAACLRDSFADGLDEGTSMHIARKVASLDALVGDDL